MLTLLPVPGIGHLHDQAVHAGGFFREFPPGQVKHFTLLSFVLRFPLFLAPAFHFRELSPIQSGISHKSISKSPLKLCVCTVSGQVLFLYFPCQLKRQHARYNENNEKLKRVILTTLQVVPFRMNVANGYDSGVQQ